VIGYINRSRIRNRQDARIAWGARKGLKLRALFQFPGQSMLAAAAANEKDVHAQFVA